MPAGAIVMGIGMAAMAGATAYGAYASSREARNAANRANAAAAERDKAYTEMVKLAKEQYTRWEQDFGEIQTEVADYYKNLTDDILKQQYEDANTEANQSLIQQYFAAQKNISSQFNKTGMAGSGAEAASTLKLQQSMLQQKATNRWQTQQLKGNAQNALMGQKQQWVSQGENLRSQAMQNQYNAQNTIGNDAAARYLQHQQQSYEAQMNMINTITSGVASIGGMMTGIGGEMYTTDEINKTNLAIAKMKYGDGNSNNSTTSSVTYKLPNLDNDTMLSLNNAATRKHLTSSDWLTDTLSGYTRNTFKNTNTKTTSLYFGAK